MTTGLFPRLQFPLQCDDPWIVCVKRLLGAQQDSGGRKIVAFQAGADRVENHRDVGIRLALCGHLARRECGGARTLRAAC